MSEENVEVKEELISASDETNTAQSAENVELKEYTETEQLAMSKGWKPDFDGPEAISAEAFIAREPLLGRIVSQGRLLKQNQDAMKQLATQNAKLLERLKAAEVKKLEVQKWEAVELGDKEAVVQVEEEIKKVSKEYSVEPSAPQATAQSSEEQEAARDFVERNKAWYNTNSSDNTEMMRQADEMYLWLRKNHSHLSPQEMISKTEQQMKTLFPNKFVNRNRVAPSTVASGEVKPSVSRDLGLIKESELNENQRKNLNIYLKEGFGTKEDFLKELTALYANDKKGK